MGHDREAVAEAEEEVMKLPDASMGSLFDWADHHDRIQHNFLDYEMAQRVNEDLFGNSLERVRLKVLFEAVVEPERYRAMLHGMALMVEAVKRSQSYSQKLGEEMARIISIYGEDVPDRWMLEYRSDAERNYL